MAASPSTSTSSRARSLSRSSPSPSRAPCATTPPQQAPHRPTPRRAGTLGTRPPLKDKGALFCAMFLHVHVHVPSPDAVWRRSHRSTGRAPSSSARSPAPLACWASWRRCPPRSATRATPTSATSAAGSCRTRLPSRSATHRRPSSPSWSIASWLARATAAAKRAPARGGSYCATWRTAATARRAATTLARDAALYSTLVSRVVNSRYYD
jgi:hypothetical protein